MELQDAGPGTGSIRGLRYQPVDEFFARRVEERIPRARKVHCQCRARVDWFTCPLTKGKRWSHSRGQFRFVRLIYRLHLGEALASPFALDIIDLALILGLTSAPVPATAARCQRTFPLLVFPPWAFETTTDSNEKEQKKKQTK